MRQWMQAPYEPGQQRERGKGRPLAPITFFMRWLLVGLLVGFVLAGPRATAALAGLSHHPATVAPITLHRDQVQWSADLMLVAAFCLVVRHDLVHRRARPVLLRPAFSPVCSATERAPPGRAAEAP